MGGTTSYGAGGYDTLLIKFNATHHEEWTKIYGLNGDDVGYAAVEMSDLGYTLTGIYSRSQDIYDMQVAKFSRGGVYEWAYSLGIADGREGLAIGHRSDDDSVVVVGATAAANSLDSDIFIAGVNATGSLMFKKAYGGEYYDAGFSVAIDGNGTFALSGLYSYGEDDKRWIFGKFNATGYPLWAREYSRDTDTTNLALSMIISSDHSYVMAGTSTASKNANHKDLMIAKWSTTPPQGCGGAITLTEVTLDFPYSELNPSFMSPSFTITDIDPDIVVTYTDTRTRECARDNDEADAASSMYGHGMMGFVMSSLLALRAGFLRD